MSCRAAPRVSFLGEVGGDGHQGGESRKPDSHHPPAQPDAATHQPPPPRLPTRPPYDPGFWPGPLLHPQRLPRRGRCRRGPASPRVGQQPPAVSPLPGRPLGHGRHFQDRPEALRPALRDPYIYPPRPMQVPLVYIAMSRRQTPDYASILRIVVRALPAAPAVTTVTTDFEGAIWQGVRRVLPDVVVRGCGFHWVQAVERQFKENGLAMAYRDSEGPLRALLRKLLALPYLPPDAIHRSFNRLEDAALEHGDSRLADLFEYVRTTWFESGVWSVESWNVYNRAVRTNNDCEGWHRRLNTRLPENVNLYLMILGLEEESLLISAQVELVKDLRLTRDQKPSYVRLQQRIVTAWREYEAGHLTEEQLLRRLSLFVRSWSRVKCVTVILNWDRTPVFIADIPTDYHIPGLG